MRGVVFVELGFEAETPRFVDELIGTGKMFAVGDNRAPNALRNGHSHIRGYAGWRAPEAAVHKLARLLAEQVRAAMLQVFDGWAPVLTDMIQRGALLSVRPICALPIGHSLRVEHQGREATETVLTVANKKGDELVAPALFIGSPRAAFSPRARPRRFLSHLAG